MFVAGDLIRDSSWWALRNDQSRFIMAVAIASFTILVGCQSEQEAVCKRMAAEYETWAAEAFGYEPANHAIDVLYSPSFDGCFHVSVAHVGVRFQIRDLSQTLMRHMPHGDYPVLFNCTSDGISSARIEMLRLYHGRVANVPFAEWQDDGYGGPSATVETPEDPLTKEDCQPVLDRWLTELSV